MKCRNLVLALFFIIPVILLPAAEENAEHSEFVNNLLNNQFMLENLRLIGLAESSYAESKFDDAIKYAEEAIQYAKKSDEYIAQQLKMKEANDAIAAAQSRLDWVTRSGAAKNNPSELEGAQAALQQALDFRSKEQWDNAITAAKQVVTILSILPEGPVLAAQYRVKTWSQVKDCLWNIAAKPEVYGDPWQWQHLYNANKSKLSKPDVIQPGTILDIPSIKGEARYGILE